MLLESRVRREAAVERWNMRRFAEVLLKPHIEAYSGCFNGPCRMSLGAP
jgi:hypothetical protein